MPGLFAFRRLGDWKRPPPMLGERRMRAIAFVLGLSCAVSSAETKVPPDADETAYPAIERFVQVLETVRKRHPDVDKVTYDRLVNHALEGMLARRRDEFAAWAGELAARGLRTADPEWDIDVLIGLVNHEAYRQFVVLNGWDRVRYEEWVCRMIALNLG